MYSIFFCIICQIITIIYRNCLFKINVFIIYTDRKIQKDGGDDDGCGERSAHISRLSSRCRPDVPAAAAVVRAFAHGRTSRVTLAVRSTRWRCGRERGERARAPAKYLRGGGGGWTDDDRRGAKKKRDVSPVTLYRRMVTAYRRGPVVGWH